MHPSLRATGFQNRGAVKNSDPNPGPHEMRLMHVSYVRDDFDPRPMRGRASGGEAWVRVDVTHDP